MLGAHMLCIWGGGRAPVARRDVRAHTCDAIMEGRGNARQARPKFARDSKVCPGLESLPKTRSGLVSGAPLVMLGAHMYGVRSRSRCAARRTRTHLRCHHGSVAMQVQCKAGSAKVCPGLESLPGTRKFARDSKVCPARCVPNGARLAPRSCSSCARRTRAHTFAIMESRGIG